MVFGINGNVYGYSNPRQKLAKKGKEKKKEKGQLGLFIEENISENTEPNPDDIPHHYQHTLPKFEEKNNGIEKLILQISETKRSEELAATLDVLIHDTNKPHSKQKINDITTILVSASKKKNPFSIQKIIIEGLSKLLRENNGTTIKKKCLVGIITLIDQNNHSIKSLKLAKRPEISLPIITQKNILEQCYPIIEYFGKTPLLTKTCLRLMKNSIQNGDLNIKKIAVQLISQSVPELYGSLQKQSEEMNHILTLLEEIKYMLADEHILALKLHSTIRILSERNNS